MNGIFPKLISGINWKCLNFTNPLLIKKREAVKKKPNQEKI